MSQEIMPPAREVTIGKLRRDAENLRKHARFVIVLGAQVEIIDNEHLIEGQSYAPLIAVLGPVEHKGNHLDQSVVLEIGYSHTCPYMEIAKRLTDEHGMLTGERWRLNDRIRVRRITDSELARVYPHIVRCMAQVVYERCKNRKQEEKRWVPGPGRVKTGTYFTVSKEDERLHQQMLMEDVRYRKRRYMTGHARRIRRLLRRYLRSSYTAKQLDRMIGVQRTLDVLLQTSYTPFYRSALIRSKECTNIRALLECIVDKFGIDVSISAHELAALEPQAVTLPELDTLWCYCRRKERVRKATNATSFELILEEEFRDRNEVPF